LNGLLSSVGRSGLSRGVDVVVAVVLAVFAVADLWVLELTDDLSGHRLAATPFAILVPAGLAWRRRAPVAAAVFAAVGLALQGLLVAPTTSVAQIPTLLVLAFSLGAHTSPGRALIGLSAAVAAIVSLAIGSSDSAGGIVSIPFFLGVPWLAGVAVRAARGYAERLERLTEQLERERERSSRLAVAEERARIARELHDVVAHGVGVMAIQAAGARRIVERDPVRAGGALASIESTGRVRESGCFTASLLGSVDGNVRLRASCG
jgi:signal transduction histidine kinase